MATQNPSQIKPSKQREENGPHWEEKEEEDEEKGSFEEESRGKEEVSSSEEEEDGSSEESNGVEQKIGNPQPKSLPRAKEEDGSDSEESDTSPSQFKVQPITKRPFQESDSNIDSPRSNKRLKFEEKKPAPVSVSAASGSGCITRLWTDQDEIALLEGMLNFKNQKGVDPYTDMGAFYDYIKNILQLVVSKSQMSSKVSRMKKRFLNAMKKSDNGEDPVFSKPHECMVFDLSKKIWGGAVINSNKQDNSNTVVEHVNKDNGKSAVSHKNENKHIVPKKTVGEGDFWSSYPYFRRSFDENVNCLSLSTPEAVRGFVQEKMSLVGRVKADELEEKWKNLYKKETELYFERLNLMMEQSKLALGM